MCLQEETLLNAMNDELPKIQEQVYYGQIESRTNVLDKLLSESGLSRYNPQVGSFTGSIFCNLLMCLFITNSKKCLPLVIALFVDY